MNSYNFSLEVIQTYKILEDTEVFLIDGVDFNSVQDVILSLLPEASEIEDTPARLKIVTLSRIHDIVKWELIFKCPQGYNHTDLMEYIQEQATKIDNSFDHYYSPSIPTYYIGKDPTPVFCKIAFKVE